MTPPATHLFDDNLMGNMVAAAGFAVKRRLKVNATNVQTSEVFTGGGLNDLTPGGTFSGVRSHLYKVIVTTSGTPDKYDWYRDGVLQESGVAMVGGAVSLDNGVEITFAADNGHVVAEFWEFEATITTDRHKIDGNRSGLISALRLSLDQKVYYQWQASESEPSSSPIISSAAADTGLVQAVILNAGNGITMRIPWGLLPTQAAGLKQPGQDLYLWIEKHTSDAVMQIAEL